MSKFNTSFRPAKQLLGAAVALAMGLASATASAVTVTNVPAGGATASVMADALLANNSGINIVGGSAAIQGTNTAGVRQFGTYSGFNLAPSTGSGPTLAMANGVVLTSGSATVPNSNTTGSFSTTTNSGANAQLTALAGRPTFDANTLGFDFTVAAGVKSVSAQFVFASEEFPDQAVTDIFGFFIDGVNYARFADGDLISNEPGSGNFVSNVNGAYGIEYDGLTNVLTVTGLLDELLSTHSLMFGVADTSDSVYDSAVYMNSLIAGQAGTGGLSNDVPEPGSAFLFAIAMAGAAAARRKKARK
jgi:hypothetical protein